jgi:AAA domain
MIKRTCTNIKHILDTYLNLRSDVFDKVLDCENLAIDKSELGDINKLFIELEKLIEDNYIFDGYHINYSIPQISKEFDLLRIGGNYILDIEIKSQPIDIIKIKKQLIQNTYYLKFINENVYCYTYIASVNKLYYLDKVNLIECNFANLYKHICNQEVIIGQNINKLFNPSNYLISPFNSTDEFVSQAYFLTSQQDDFKTQIEKLITSPKYMFFAITGAAGTGKTLLVYDIVSSYLQESLIIHCGILNNGQYLLRDKYNWNIISIKDYAQIDFSKYSIVIIDEAQRIRPNQFDLIVKMVKSNNSTCIFSYDSSQCLRIEEIHNNIDSRIQGLVQKKFSLSDKIRTNKGIANFIRGLLNSKFKSPDIDRENIDVKYFQKASEVRSYLCYLSQSDWKVINYTPSKHQNLTYDKYFISETDNAHQAIGQEFNNVVVVIDGHFTYSDNGFLSTKGYKYSPYYSQLRMFGSLKILVEF